MVGGAGGLVIALLVLGWFTAVDPATGPPSEPLRGMPGREAAARTNAALQPEPGSRAVSAEVEPGLSVTGRTVDAGGNPIAGVAVGVAARSRAALEPPRQRTAADGRFALAVTERVPFSLTFEHPAYAPRSRRWVPTRDDVVVDLGDVLLTAGSTITGRLVDEDDRGIGGAQVECLAADSRGSVGAITRSTDGDGSFRFDCVPPGQRWIVVRAEGHQRVRTLSFECAGHDRVDLGDLRLPAGFALSGTVHDDRGLPVAGAHVAARASATGLLQGTASSAADGNLRLPHLPATAVDVEVRAEGFLPAHLRRVDQTTGPVAVVLERARIVRGRVVAVGGNAVPEFAVRARRLGGLGEDDLSPPTLHWPADFGAASRWTDGRFEVGGLGTGTFALEVRAPGMAPRRTAPFVLAPDLPAPFVEVQLQRGGTVRGRVIAADEGPAPATPTQSCPAESFTVELCAVESLATDVVTDADPQVVSRTVTDAHGRYRLDQLPAGTFVVRAIVRGRRAAMSAPFEAGPGATVGPIDLSLRPAGSLCGLVRGVPTTPDVPLRVLARPARGDRAVRFARVAADGRYAIADLAAGDYELQLAPGAGPIVLATVDAGRAAHIDLEADREAIGGMVTGRVIRGGVAAAGLAVSLAGSACRCLVGPDGRFELAGVPTGTQELQVADVTGGPSLHRCDVEVGSGRVVQVDVRLP